MGDLTKILNETIVEIDEQLPLKSDSIAAIRDIIRMALDKAYKTGLDTYVVRPERRSGRDRRILNRS